jgi:hypothetical protein
VREELQQALDKQETELQAQITDLQGQLNKVCALYNLSTLGNSKSISTSKMPFFPDVNYSR